MKHPAEVAMMAAVTVLALLSSTAAAESMFSLYKHPDKNQGFAPGFGTTLHAAGFYPLQGPDLQQYDNELTSMVVQGGRLQLFSDTLGQNWIATIDAKQGFLFDPINLQAENDNLVSAVEWKPAQPDAQGSQRRRSLLSANGPHPADLVSGSAAGRAVGSQLLQIEEWGAVSTDPKLVLFQHQPSSYAHFARGQQLVFTTCSKAPDLAEDGFNDAASSMLVCGGRARGYADVGFSQQLFDVVVKSGSCIDFGYGDGSTNVLSSLQFNVCGCGIDC